MSSTLLVSFGFCFAFSYGKPDFIWFMYLVVEVRAGPAGFHVFGSMPSSSHFGLWRVLLFVHSGNVPLPNFVWIPGDGIALLRLLGSPAEFCTLS